MAPTHQTARLGPGRHDRPGAVVCIMQLTTILSGERFSDWAATVWPIIGALIHPYNDTVEERRREDLYRFAAEAVGSRGDFALQLRRAAAALAWARDSYETRKRLVWRPPTPEVDDGPDRIARYVV